MQHRTNESTRRRHEDDGREDASTLFMLNCYDVWSATPKSSAAFDCGQGSDAAPDRSVS